jgi:hypothetical protein
VEDEAGSVESNDKKRLILPRQTPLKFWLVG